MTLVRSITLLTLLATLLAARASLRSWVNPVTALVLPFLAAIGLQAIRLGFLPFGWRAAVVVAGGPLALLLGCLAANSVRARTGRRRAITDLYLMARVTRRNQARRHVLTLAGVGCVLISGVYTFIIFRSVVIDQNSVVDGVFYREAFLSGSGYNLLYRFLQLSTYLGALFLVFDTNARGYLRPVPLAFAVFTVIQSIILSTRSSSFLIVLIFGAGYALCHGRSLSRLPLRAFAVGGVSFVLMFGLFAQVALDRAGRSEVNPFRSFEYILAGSPSALSLSLDGDVRVEVDRSFGLSFAGILELVGLRPQRTFGIYDQGTIVLHPHEAKSQTNVFTWYFPLISDFGIPGTFLVLFGIGLFVQPLTNRAISGRASASELGVATTVYVLLLWALNAPLTYYNTFWMMLAMCPVLRWLYASRPGGAAQSEKSGAINQDLRVLV